MQNTMNIVNKRYPESSVSKNCSCDIVLEKNTKITFYDAGFTGSGDSIIPVSFNIIPYGYALVLNSSPFLEEDYTIGVPESASVTIDIKIQPDRTVGVAKHMWFWIHLKALSGIDEKISNTNGTDANITRTHADSNNESGMS